MGLAFGIGTARHEIAVAALVTVSGLELDGVENVDNVWFSADCRVGNQRALSSRLDKKQHTVLIIPLVWSTMSDSRRDKALNRAHYRSLKGSCSYACFLLSTSFMSS